MSSASVLSLDRVAKRFGDLEAVRDLSFEVRAGEIFGFLGPIVVMTGPLAFQIPGSINATSLLLTTLLALLGLYLYNAMIAGLMASAQSLQSASNWQGTFLLLPFIPCFLLSPLLENPDSVLMMLLSWVPLLSPVMLPVRLVQGAVQPWEIVLATALLSASCWAMRVLAGRVFRLGMLMYGKDMTLPELIRWARVK